MKTILLFCAAAVAFAQPRVPQVTPLARLEGQITRITRDLNATWGIYIKCLETGETIAINADQPMDTMSVIKIPLMAEAFRQIEAGKFKLGDRVTYTAESLRPTSSICICATPTTPCASACITASMQPM